MTRIQVFARAPTPGQTKTRLIPALGAEGAAALHARLIRHTLRVAGEAGADRVELWCSPDTRDHFFEACAQRYGVVLRDQAGGDLGARMGAALADARATGEHAVLVGSDCPAMTAAHLRRAMDWLASGVELVLGPAQDGGYVLIGAGRPEPTLFTDMPWGSERVLAETLARAREAGLVVQCLEPLPDLDRPEDLLRVDLDALAD